MSDIQQLGYLGFEVADLDAWEAFSTEVLGLEVVSREGGLQLCMDGHGRRFFLTEGPADDLSVVGWQVADAAALADVAARLRAAGVDVTEGDPGPRHVEALIRFRDPAGVPTEVFHGPQMAGAPFASARATSGFVADDLGLGHLVLTTRDKAESLAFYTDALGFRVSDHVVTTVAGYDIDLTFLPAPGPAARHHSLALGGPQRHRLHHFMLEVKAFDDVGLCYDRALRAGVPIFHTLGRHPNDRMFSFYAFTPSGFQFEFGWGGRVVDDARWEIATHDRISEWGHHHPSVFRKKR